MRLVINSAHQRFGGAIQVVLSFVNECRKFPEHEYHVWVGPGLKKSLLPEEFGENFKFYYFDFGPITFRKTFKINRTLKRFEDKINPDVIIATSGPTYYESSAPQVIGYNLPLYIYPESPFIKNLSLFRKLRWLLKKSVHRYFFRRDGSAFLTQTDDVKERAKKYLGRENIYTVTNTFNGFYKNWRPTSKRLPDKALHSFRLITISSYYPHKNLEIIPQVQRELISRGIDNVEFITTMGDKDFNEKIAHGAPRIINVGPVKPEDCPSLYDECDIMFLPTLAECFSASYPEAMVMEKPIITTNLGFARSICGDAALYFEPMNPKAAAESIKELISDKSLWDQLTKRGKRQLNTFDTAATRAERYLDICKNTIKDNALVE